MVSGWKRRVSRAMPMDKLSGKVRHIPRQRKLRAALSAQGLDALVVTHPPNILYLCGFSGSAGVLVVFTSRRGILFTDARYTLQAGEESAGVRVSIASGSLLESAGESLRARGARQAGYEKDRMTVSEKSRLSAAARRGGLSGRTGIIEALRMVKDQGELAQMAAAACLASAVLTAVLPLVRPGARECDLAAEIEYQMRRGGASAAAFETIVASGPRSALPHARATGRRLRKNELVVLDLGAILRHYCSDLTRTLYLGKAPRRIREWYGAVREAQAAAINALRPGISGQQVDQAARRVLAGHGLEKGFTHSLGHGLGLEVHEAPRLARGQKGRLEAGNVVTVEPGVYRQGIGGIRIEDVVVVTPRGARVLTTVSRDVWELG